MKPNTINIFKCVLSQYDKGYYKLMLNSINQYYKGPHNFFVDLHAYLLNDSDYFYPLEKYVDVSTQYHMMLGD